MNTVTLRKPDGSVLDKAKVIKAAKSPSGFKLAAYYNHGDRFDCIRVCEVTSGALVYDGEYSTVTVLKAMERAIQRVERDPEQTRKRIEIAVNLQYA